VRLPRFRCSSCGRVEVGTRWPAHCRSTPELDQLQAHLSALLTYRVATGVLAHLLPVAAGTSHETFRGHTPKLGEALRDAAVVTPAVAAAPASAIAISLDSTYIRSCHEGELHLEVRVGNAERHEGGRQVFGAVANAGTDIVALIRRTLGTLGRTGDTELTAFTDGCSGLRSILAAAGVASLPILDCWGGRRLLRALRCQDGCQQTPQQDPSTGESSGPISAAVPAIARCSPATRATAASRRPSSPMRALHFRSGRPAATWRSPRCSAPA
jgi:hypothetical protein